LARAKNSGVIDFDLTKVFYNQDRAVHHFDNVAYSLSLSSSRIYNYESINHENMEGWYSGDGMMTCLGTDSNAYKEIWEQIDPYKLPLTTLDNRPRDLVSISQRNEYLSSESFVGGVEAPASLAAAMILESYHGNGEHIDNTYFREDGTQGGPPEKRECTLRAKKGYFINGKIAVLLGSGISAHDGAEVYTVVDSRQSESSVRKVSENALYLDGFGGYLVLEGKVNTGRGGKNNGFEEIIIEHGMDPNAEKYAFAYLPDYNEDKIREFSSSAPFKILSNTESLQAVEFSDGTCSYVFYNSGTYNDVCVTEPLILIIKCGKLYVCDPTQLLESAVVRIGVREYFVELKNSHGKTLILDI
jgi:hyaluronate lyase